MAKKKDDGPAIELGQVWQRLKKGPETRCTVMSLNDEGVVLKNEDTEATHAISRAGLPLKFRLVGKHVSQGGEAKFVPLENIQSAPTAPALTESQVRTLDAHTSSAHYSVSEDGVGHERLKVLKTEIACPCGDSHKVKEANWDDFLEDVQQFKDRHVRCLSTNVLPFGEGAAA